MDPEIYSILPDGRLYHSYLVDTHVLKSPSKASPEKPRIISNQISPNRSIAQGQFLASPCKSQAKLDVIKLQQVPNNLYLFPPQNSHVPQHQQSYGYQNQTHYVQNLVKEIRTGEVDRFDLTTHENTMSSIELDNDLKNRFIKEMDSIIDAYKPELSSRTIYSERNEYQESNFNQIHHKASDASYISKPTQFTTNSHTPHKQSFITRQFPEENLMECIQTSVHGYSSNYHFLNTNEIIEFAKSLQATRAGVDNIEVRDRNGRLIYGGGFADGNIDGFGIIFNPFKVFKNVNMKNLNTLAKAWDSYEGYFKNGRFHGKGTLIINGEKLIGEFNEGVLNSKAMLEGKDGQRFVGNWKINQLEE